MTMKHSCTLLALTALVFLCACGGMRWHKQGVEATESVNDFAACRAESGDKGGIAATYAASTPMHPRFGPPFGQSESDIRMQEILALGKCMRGKGYELVPEAK